MKMVYNLPESAPGMGGEGASSQRPGTSVLRRGIADKYHTAISGGPNWPNSRKRGGPEPTLEEVLIQRREERLMTPGLGTLKASASSATLPPESYVRSVTAPFDRPRATQARLRMMKTGMSQSLRTLPQLQGGLSGVLPNSKGK